MDTTLRESIPLRAISWCDGVTEHLIREIIPANPNGFTFDPRERVLPTFDTDSCIVSIHGHEQRYDSPPPHDALSDWISRQLPLLQLSRFYVGGWADPSDDSFVVDISTLIRGIDTATRFGLSQRQKAIFHPVSGMSIWIEEAVKQWGKRPVGSAQ